jgi:predicted transposase YdaD
MAKIQPTKTANTTQKNAPNPFKKEGNAYDKIFKEVVEKIFRPLVEKRLGVKIVKSTPLKEKMQTTIEVEMDFFYEIVIDTGEKFILHLEFETGINPEMVYRVGEYHGMAMRREKLPIRHLVIYLGEDSPTMRTQLKPEEVYTGFDLLNVQALDTDELLSSQMPEVVLVAILSNYPKEEAETVLRKIVLKLKTLIKNKRVVKKYINQLMILSRLRSIEELTIKITEEMPIHYDIEKDALYLRGTVKGLEKGLEKGREKGLEEGKEIQAYIAVSNLLLYSDFDDAKIAQVVKVPLEFVQKVKDERTNFVSVSSLLQDTNFNDAKIVRLLNVSLAFVQKVRLIMAE